MSAQHTPVCIPVTWNAGPRPASSFLAYHHGWTDARLYNVVEIYHDGRDQSAFAGYVATVDDFGHLVPIARRNESGWGWVPSHAACPFIERGDLEYH